MNIMQLMPIATKLATGKAPSERDITTLIDAMPIDKIKPFVPSVFGYYMEMIKSRLIKEEEKADGRDYSVITTSVTGLEVAILLCYDGMGGFKAIRKIGLDQFLQELDEEKLKAMLKKSITEKLNPNGDQQPNVHREEPGAEPDDDDDYKLGAKAFHQSRGFDQLPPG